MARYLLVVALAGCASASADPDSRIPYSCEGIPVPGAVRDTPVSPSIVPPQRSALLRAPPEVVLAIETWRALAVVPASVPASGEAWLARVDAAAIASLVPREVGDRVRLQHAMLRVAERVEELRRGGPPKPAAEAVLRRVMARVRAVAATPEELAALGASSRPHVEQILGGELTERATRSCSSGNLKHVVAAHGLLAFRPLRAGATRALVAQLVAFDTTGEPHVTPLVSEVELRLGSDPSSPACVVQAGDDGVLRPRTTSEIERHVPFVTVAGDSVGCAMCHRSGNDMSARDLTTGEELAAIDGLRDAQVERLARSRWSALSWDSAALLTAPLW